MLGLRFAIKRVVRGSALTIHHHLLLVQDLVPPKNTHQSCAIILGWGVEVLVSHHPEPHGNM